MWLRLMKNVGHRSSLFTTETGLKVWKGRFYGSSSTTRTTTTTTTTTSNNFNAGKSGKKSNDTINHIDIPIVDFDDPDYLPLADYPKRLNETLEVKKQRLLYQSRKRGMLENDLLLSTFAAKYLKDLNPKLTEQYDRLINGVSNDWDIYYWATNRKSTPIQYDNDIMRMLKDHVKNVNREPRLRQPNL